MTHLRVLTATETRTSLVDALRRQPRAFTFAELASMASARKARTAIARGDIARVLPDAYVAGIHAEAFVARVDAALLWAGPSAALSGPAAMFAWGFLEQPPDVIDIVLPHPLHVRTPEWLRVRRINWKPPVSRVNGMTVVGPAHAVVLGYGRLPVRERANAVYRAISTRLVTAQGLMATLESVPRIGARRELHARLLAAAAGAESFLEEHSLRKVFHTAEFARFVRQHRVVVSGEVSRLDMFDPSTLTAVELDSDKHHSSQSQRRRDLRRDARLATVGILTVRIPYRDLMDRPDWCRALVRGVLVSRASLSGA